MWGAVIWWLAKDYETNQKDEYALMKSVRRLVGRITLRYCAGHEWRYLFVKLLHNQAIERLASMQSQTPDNFRT
jgi:hypothetical protein